MKSKDESIQLLKMRMQHHMDVSSEKIIRPENIQAYVSSLMMQAEDKQAEDKQTDMEYIQKFGESTPTIKDIKVPESIGVQHERAKNEYEKVLRSEEELFGYRGMHWLNIKG